MANIFTRFFNFDKKIADIPLDYHSGYGNVNSYIARMPLKEKTLETLSKHFSTVKVEHFNKNQFRNIEDDLSYLFMFRPNNKQTSVQMYYTFFYNLFRYGNAFILPKYKGDKVVSLHVLDMSNTNFSWITNKNGDERYIRVVNSNFGTEKIVDYADIIHLRLNPSQIQNDEEMYVLQNNIPEIIDENLTSILSELKSNFDVRGVLKVGNAVGTLNNALIDEKSKQKKVDSLLTRVKSKILVLDSGEEWEEKSGGFLKSSIEDMNMLEDKYYEFFGLSSGIAHSNYTFEEYSAFHKAVLEPKLKDFEQEVNYKMLSRNKLSRGETFTFRIPIVSGMSFADMTNYFDKMKYYGVYNTNEIREIIGEVPINQGKEYTGNLNMANPDGTKPGLTKGGDNDGEEIEE